MLFNVETRRLLPNRRMTSTYELAELQAATCGEGDDAGNLAVVIGWHDDADALWVNRDGLVVARDESSPPLITPMLPIDPPTIDDVWREKERRLALGFDYDFGDERGVHHIGTTPSDMAGWDEVTKFAQALINAGTPKGNILILTDTGPAEVTAAEWQQMLLAAAAFRQPLWLRSFEITAMDPIPADYTSDEHWTA